MAVAIYFVVAIDFFVCSIICYRIAHDSCTAFYRLYEVWGLGFVNIFTPLFNGFPHTGALARTAVNIRLGAVSPLAGVAKFGFKLTLALYLARYLEMVPMACIGGILLYVAAGMVKVREIREVLSMKSVFHTGLMGYTAIMVPVAGFMTAVLSAIVIFVVSEQIARRIGTTLMPQTDFLQTIEKKHSLQQNQ